MFSNPRECYKRKVVLDTSVYWEEILELSRRIFAYVLCFQSTFYFHRGIRNLIFKLTFLNLSWNHIVQGRAYKRFIDCVRSNIKRFIKKLNITNYLLHLWIVWSIWSQRLSFESSIRPECFWEPSSNTMLIIMNCLMVYFFYFCWKKYFV